MRTTPKRQRLLRSVIAGAAVLSVVGAGAGVAAAATHSGSSPAPSTASAGTADRSCDGKLDRSSRDTSGRHTDAKAHTVHTSTLDRSVDTRPDR